MQTKLVTATLSLALSDKVDQLAARLDRSPGWIVEQALTVWIDREEKHRHLTLEAMADVDAGRLVEDRAVQAWAESLEMEVQTPAPR